MPPLLAGKLWDNKLGEASKALDEQLSSVVGTASSALDSGLAAASEAVRAGVSSAARETSDIKSRLQQFYDTGVAHYQAAEQQALDGVKRGVWYVRHDHPEASLAGGVALAAVLLPGPRRFLLRQTIGRFRSEEAMYRSAELRYGALKERVEGQTGDLHKLQASTGGSRGCRLGARAGSCWAGLGWLGWSSSSTLHTLDSQSCRRRTAPFSPCPTLPALLLCLPAHLPACLPACRSAWSWQRLSMCGAWPSSSRLLGSWRAWAAGCRAAARRPGVSGPPAEGAAGCLAGPLLLAPSIVSLRKVLHSAAKQPRA